jgi:hypothetical protein
MGAWFQRELLKGFFSYAALTVQFFMQLGMAQV